MEIDTLLAIKKQCNELTDGNGPNCKKCPLNGCVNVKLSIDDDQINHDLVEFIELELSACSMLVQLLSLPEVDPKEIDLTQ